MPQRDKKTPAPRPTTSKRAAADARRAPAKTHGVRTAAQEKADDPLLVQSVVKAFRVLEGFDPRHPTLSLTQLAARIDLDISATQRFAHTLVKLGYLRKEASTKRFELTSNTLNIGYYFLRSNPLVQRAMPYLLSLGKETQETVNLTVLEDTEIVFTARLMSYHVLNTNTYVGSRMPAYCASSGIAILSRMPRPEAMAVLRRSDLRAHTPHTVHTLADLERKLDLTATRGYATAFEEYYAGDLSIAAPIVNPAGYPVGAVNVAVSKARWTPEDAERKLGPLVVATALAILP